MIEDSHVPIWRVRGYANTKHKWAAKGRLVWDTQHRTMLGRGKSYAELMTRPDVGEVQVMDLRTRKTIVELHKRLSKPKRSKRHVRRYEQTKGSGQVAT